MELVEVKELNLQKTELGEIPSDWIASTFGETFTGFSSGMTPFRGVLEYYKGDIPWITSGELNYNIITDTWEKITEEAVIKTNLKIHPVGTFLMAITGLEAAGTRGSCAITGIKSTTNQSCMALFPIQGKTTTEYLYHFYVRYGNELAFKYCQGTKQQSYTGRIAKRLPINLPPTLNEQKAIAQVLSDTDALIHALEKKIAKKKLIKKGVMQKLLTPKEDWQVKTIKDIVSTPVTDGPHETPKFVSDGIPFLSVNNIVDNKIDESDLRFISKNDDALYSKKCKPQMNDILLGKAASVGKVAIVESEWDFNIWSPLALIRTKSDVYSYLIYYLFQTEDVLEQIDGLTNSSSQGNIGMGDIEKLTISYPKHLKEQKSIANIFIDIDKEIEHLEQKLSKYQLAKQGMMQQLLTGKIRLV